MKLMRSPDTEALLTGDTIKEGEIFEATDMIKLEEPKGAKFLKVGARGWIFDKGGSGRRKSKRGVEAMPPGVQRDMATMMLRDPESYENYQGSFGVEDVEHYLADTAKKYGSSLDAFRNATDEAFNVPDGDQVRDEIDDDAPDLGGQIKYYQQLTENEARFRARTTVVAPKWMKLAGKPVADLVKVDEDGQPLLLVAKAPPTKTALENRPSARGCWMGIRVPTVCSPL